MQQNLTINAAAMAAEMAWLSKVIAIRLDHFFGEPDSHGDINKVPPPVPDDKSAFGAFLKEHPLNLPERLVLALGLAPNLQPELMDSFMIHNKAFNKPFTKFGGVAGSGHAGFLPTGETAAFLFSGDNLDKRFIIHSIFEPDRPLIKNHVITLEASQKEEPTLSGRITVSPDSLYEFTLGTQRKPGFSNDFPAKVVSTEMDWEEVVLPGSTLQEVQDIRDWVEHGQLLLNKLDLARKIKPGYKVLFYGPPGTGKTLTACLLGKTTGKAVYKIDLSMVVSKYIGETEKNLSKVFNQAESRDWILFFDEADALFGKRTEVQSSHDRFANQEVAYLLQRIEDHPGLVILASNMKDNIDPAFMRRFQNVVHFPMPGPEERAKLWQQSFSPKLPLNKAIDMAALADLYELSGGVIMNVVQYSTIKALKNGHKSIAATDLETGIKRELMKVGKGIF